MKKAAGSGSFQHFRFLAHNFEQLADVWTADRYLGPEFLLVPAQGEYCHLAPYGLAVGALRDYPQSRAHPFQNL